MILYIGIGIGVCFLLFLIILSLYRIVNPSEAHVVVGPTKKMVCSPDNKIQKNGGSWYFMIPFIRTVRILSTLIQELKTEQETIEKADIKKSKAKYLSLGTISNYLKQTK